MIRKICFVIILICVFSSFLNVPASAGQNLQRKYAAFTTEKYPDDDFILLLEDTSVFLRQDGSYQVRQYELYKILKDEAKDSLGQKSTQYDSSREEVKIIKARSISADGVVQEADQIQDIDILEPYPAYSNYKAKITTMPNLQKGSLIEFETVSETKYSYIKGHYWEDWAFASVIPIVESRFEIKLPAGIPLNYKENNIDFRRRERLIDKRKYKIYKWRRKGYKKIETEEYMPTLFELCPELGVSTIPSWDYVACWAQDLFKDASLADAALKRQTSLIIKGKKDKGERIAAIFRYIQDNIRYVSLSFGEHAFKPHPAADVLKNKYGDCKDQSVLLIAMLKEAGIEAYPALIHFENDGPVELRSIGANFFSHAIARVKLDEGFLWLDPTSRGYDFSDTPYGLFNATALVLDDKKAHFEKLPEPDLELAEDIVNAEFKIMPDGSVSARREIIDNYPASAASRFLFKNASAKDKEEFKNKFISRISPGAKVDKFIYSDPKNLKEPFKMSFEYSSADFAYIMGNYMMLPIPTAGSRAIFSFSKTKRLSPIVIRHPRMTTTRYTYRIPKGYKIRFVPSSVSLEMPLGGCSLLSSFDEKNGIINIETKFWIERKRLPASDYSKIRAYYAEVSKLFKQQILLEKV